MSFQSGDTVRILRRDVAGHHRVPGYVMDRVGVVTEVLGPEAVPEEAALGHAEPARVPVYRVRLDQTSLWPRYEGLSHDTLEIEVHQHWLAPADGPDPGRPET